MTHPNSAVDDPLKGPMLRIERANQFIDEFAAIRHDFLKAHPIEVFKEPHVDGRHKVVKLKLTSLFPDHAAIIVGDVCSSLRSALDQLTVALARAHGAKSVGGIYFPICGNAEEFYGPGTQAKIKKLSIDARDLIASFKPYKGGNNNLWSLSKLRVTDFHHNLIDVTADCMPLIEQPKNLNFDWRRSIEKKETHRFGGFPWSFIDHSMTVAIVPHDSNVEDHLSVALEVVFREPDTLDGLPVLRTLNDFSSLVQRIVLTFRARFFS